jgi:predicted dehydrogenase
MDKSLITRRDFFQSAVRMGAAVGVAPLLVPASVLGRNRRLAPSERITLGFIGQGGNGSGHLNGFLNEEGTQVVAVCDVDQSRRERGRLTAEAFYANKNGTGRYSGCAAYNDFRDLIARADIDAVVISTPDHWHAIPVIAAAKAGKDIYCEKPLSLTVEQGRVMSDTVRRSGVVFQTGSQLRSNAGVRLGCELALNGYLGRLEKIRARTGRAPIIGNQPTMPVPAGFDYEMWLGPAPWAPYTERRCHSTFRFILDYSGGEITDHGAHSIDLAQWGRGSELSAPVEFEGWGEWPREGLYDVAGRHEVTCRYADGVPLIIGSEGPIGTTFEGTEGSVSVHNGGIVTATPASLRTVVLGPREKHLYRSPGHRENFLECIRTRAEPIAPIEQAHRTASIAHIGNIAMQLGRKLKWDPDRERFVNDTEADRLLSRPMRGPWRLS